jgi:hypothetical protein
MRETSKGERAHLPESTYEEWLKSEVARPGTTTRHKVPVDLYEKWLGRKVKERLLHGKARTSKIRRRPATYHAK